MIDESWYRRPPGLRERLAAGGVVVRLVAGRPFVALVREPPGYVLPKGGVEAGETLEAAARREVVEEAGLSRLELLGPLGVCERCTFDKTYWSKTHVFLFATEQESGVPTDPKHVSAAAWFALDKLPGMFWPEQRALIESKRETIGAIFEGRGLGQSARPRR